VTGDNHVLTVEFIALSLLFAAFNTAVALFADLSLVTDTLPGRLRDALEPTD